MYIYISYQIRSDQSLSRVRQVREQLKSEDLHGRLTETVDHHE